MLVWALLFLVLSGLCALFGFGFLSGLFGCIAKGAFIIFLIGFVLSLFSIKKEPDSEDDPRDTP